MSLVQQAEQFKTAGNDFLKQKKYAEAATHYTQGLDLLTKSGEEHGAEVKTVLSTLYSNRCAAYLSQQEFTPALTDAQKALEIRPDWNRAMLRVGQALVGLSRLEEAVEHLNKCLQQHSGDQQLQQLLTETQQRLQQQQQQEQVAGIGSLFKGQDVWKKIQSNPKLAPFMQQPDFVQMIKQIQENPSSINSYLQDPRVLQVMAALIGVDMEQGDEGARRAEEEERERERKREEENRTKAEKEKQRKEEEERKKRDELESMSSEEKKALELKNQGNTLYKNRQFAEAIELYDQAIKLSPENILYRLNRAAALLEMNELDECIKECNEAINIGSFDFKAMAKAYTRMGNAYMKKKDYGNAIKSYKDALVEHRTRDVALKVQEAEKLKRIAEEEAYQNPEISRQEREKGNELFKAGKFPEAVQCYKEAIKRNPNDPAGYSNLAAAYMKLAEYPYAVKNCDEALKRDPNFIKAYIRKAQSQVIMKEYHRAMETFQEGLKIDADNSELKDGYQRLMILIQTGEKDEERIKRAQADPEIQKIMQDPFMAQVLQDLSQNPASANKHMQNPDIANKINKLIAAGIIQTR